MGKEIVVRKAKPEDKEAVLSFCQKTWEWGDYIPKVWDRWIKDPAGKIFVGIIDGKPVGITNVIIVKEWEAWLRGARTHPDYRRKRDLEQIWEYLEKSKCFRRCHGLYAKLYIWVSLEKETLRSFIEDNKCIKAEINGDILGLTLIDDEVSREWQESSIQVCYIDGNFEAVAIMSKFLKKFCKEKEVKKIYTVSSDHPTIIRVFEHLGFKREELKR